MLDGRFIRGTTPTHQFGLPFDIAVINDFSITYSQNKKVLVKKTRGQCEIIDNVINVYLTQEESLKFQAGKIAEVQLKLSTEDGNVLASNKYRLEVVEVLDTEVFDV